MEELKAWGIKFDWHKMDYMPSYICWGCKKDYLKDGWHGRVLGFTPEMINTPKTTKAVGVIIVKCYCDLFYYFHITQKEAELLKEEGVWPKEEEKDEKTL